MTVLRSRGNARVRRWRRLMRDARAWRGERRALLEGPHLVAALLASGARPETLIASEKGMANPEIAALVERAAITPLIVSQEVLEAITDIESPSGLVAEIALPVGRTGLGAAESAVFLDGVQDAGNVGAVLRSAAAFGLRVAVLGPGCADHWSPKVLRAAMGAHFALQITLARDLAATLAEFPGVIACTVPQGGQALPEVSLPHPVGWLFGAEGRGVSAALARSATLQVSIPMAGSAESLNVAAAAAICLYEMARQRSQVRRPGR